MDLLARAAALIAISIAGCTTPRDVPAAGGVHPEGWADPDEPGLPRQMAPRQRRQALVLPAVPRAGLRGRRRRRRVYRRCHTQPGGPTFCGTCHGSDSGPLPKTGAHALHAAFCHDCHDVPEKYDDPGHITGEVRVVFSGLALTGGAKPSFDPATKTCSGVYCHVNQSPVWQKPPATIACDTCHDAPPPNHAAWSRVATPESCATCHPVPPGATPRERQGRSRTRRSRATPATGRTRPARRPSGSTARPRPAPPAWARTRRT